MSLGVPFILATAGHVDHGKSSLVKALTGTDPDRLPEEKARGITIDLGFAHLELTSPVASSEARREVTSRDAEGSAATAFSCGIVDVPGHEDFVKNMVAGVGAVDLALMVVAADDGWMPQSEEHLQILEYLGVTRAVVALTKVDLCPDPGGVAEDLRRRLAGTAFADAAIVPTSIPANHGLDDLKAALARTLVSTPRPANFGKPRLSIDRVFVLPGVGSVVTGTLCGGSLSRGESVVIQPSGKVARVRSCQSHGRDMDRVLPGTRVALNLAEVTAAELSRGQVVTRAGLGSPVSVLDAVVVRTGRSFREGTGSRRPVPSESAVRFHLGATQCRGRVLFLEAASLASGGECLAQVRLDEPVMAFVGDRFLLRDVTGRETLAGGIVLDRDTRRYQARSLERRNALKACATRPDDPDAFIAAAVGRIEVRRIEELLVASRFSSEQIRESVDRLVASRRLVVAGNHVVDATGWSELLRVAGEAVDRFHQAHPEQRGMPVTEFRSALPGRSLPAEVFESLVRNLESSGWVFEAEFVRRQGHQPSLPAELAIPGRQLRDRLGRAPFDPPARGDLVTDEPAALALRHFLQTGQAIELAHDVILIRDAFELARRRIVLHLRRHARATTSELRQVLSTTRRVIVPLLERLDRDGVTIREGDHRRLRVPANTAGTPRHSGLGASPTRP